MKNILFSWVITSIITSSVKAQVTSPAFDPVWAAKFQTAIDNAVASGKLKGASVALTFPGMGTFIGKGGESTAGIPITPDMQFCIASNTKLFTVAIIMKLQELGILSLDDHLNEWLPAYPYIDANATIRQLLSHQTGFGHFQLDVPGGPAYLEDTFYTPENTLAIIEPPYFSPGEAYDYSNTNYILAGLVIEAASGASYTENLHTYIFDPLDMDSTFLSGYEEPNGNIAHGWYKGKDLGNIPNKKQVSLAWASGAIYSTASEMVQWYDNLFAGNIISQSSLDEITKFEPGSFYGLGLQMAVHPFFPDDDVWSHLGVWYGSWSVMGYDVKGRGSLCVLINGKIQENLIQVLAPVVLELYNNYPLKPNDAGVVSVISPTSEGCETFIHPQVELKNFGSVTLASATINYQFDAGAVNTISWTGNISTNNTATVSLPAITLAAGYHTFKCYTSSPNGNAEGYTYNDAATSAFSVNTGSVLTLVNEDFEGAQFPPAGWVSGSNRILDWGKSSLALLSGTGCAVKYNADDETGRSYDLELPQVDLSGMINPVLSFNYAYGYSGEGLQDELAVMVSTDCGSSYQTIFDKIGGSLKTAPTNDDDGFFPKDNEWRLKTFNLSAYNDEVLIKFRATTGGGDNLFIDNVKVFNNTDLCAAPTDLDVVQVTTSSAKVTWQFHGNANKFDVYYRPQSSVSWSHKEVAGNKQWVNISGLLSDTDYEWYITATCSSGNSLASAMSYLTTDPEQPGITSSSIVSPEVPDLQNQLKIFPNPAMSNATISFSLSKPGKVSLNVYSIEGKLIKIIGDRNFEAGAHQLSLDTKDLKAGIYILNMQSQGSVQTKKLIVVK